MPVRPNAFRLRRQPTRREQNREYDAQRRDANPVRSLYGTGAWRKIRARQLRDHPFCVKCEEQGVAVQATVCDHVTPHRGDVEKFWAGPFQSLCARCHNSTKQREERGLAEG